MTTPANEEAANSSDTPTPPAEEAKDTNPPKQSPAALPMTRVPLGQLATAHVDLAEGMTIIGVTTRATLANRQAAFEWLERIINPDWFRSLFPELQQVGVTVSTVWNLRGWTIEVKAAPATPDQAQALANRLMTAQVDVPVGVVPVAAPASPTSPPPSKSNTPPWLWAAVGALALVLVGLLIVLVGRGGTTPDPVPTNTTVAIPSVVGFTVADATRELESAGLIVGDIREQPSDQPKGVILQQSPRSGEVVASGARVNLVVAGDSEPVIPDLVGLSQADATNALLEAGFRLGKIESQDSPKPVGTVIAQTPVAGNTAPKDTEVSLVLSTGIVNVPPVVGFSEAEAVAVLEDAGFKVKKQSQPSSQVGVVIAQTPEAGAKLEVGKTIVITVGAEAPPTPSPTPSPSESTT